MRAFDELGRAYVQRDRAALEWKVQGVQAVGCHIGAPRPFHGSRHGEPVGRWRDPRTFSTLSRDPVALPIGHHFDIPLLIGAVGGDLLQLSQSELAGVAEPII